MTGWDVEGRDCEAGWDVEGGNCEAGCDVESRDFEAGCDVKTGTVRKAVRFSPTPPSILYRVDHPCCTAPRTVL